MDGNWNPKMAAAYDQLGLALRTQGKLADAEDAFRSAIHNYYDYPKTRKEQADAVVHLGETLDLEGKQDDAEEAYAWALELDPTLTSRFPSLGARLADPLAPLTALAKATTGRLVRSDDALAEAFTSLDRRVRLTYQVPGPPDGRLHAVGVHLKRVGWRADAPAWARSSTPQAMAALRLRRLLAGEASAGTLRLRAAVGPAPDAAPSGGTGGPRVVVHVHLDLPPGSPLAEADRPALLRVSLGAGGPDAGPTVQEETLPAQSLAGKSGWDYSRELTLAPGQTAVAVVVEELSSREWGGLLVDLRAGR